MPAPYKGMKTNLFRLTTALALILQFAGCTDRFSSVYVLDLPEVPEPWRALLGEPFWRVEWFDSGGIKKMKDILPGIVLEIELPVTWANPVSAWPHWPEYNLIPGLFMPAGALYPFDAGGNRLHLSWETGPAAVFYRELALANMGNNSRIPAIFDWPRFRELLTGEAINSAVREDPWLVNWRSVAERTVSGTFDRRRLVPEAAEDKIIPVSAGFWFGNSPFSRPVFFREDELPVFPVRPGVNVWISAGGILRVNGDVWVFTAWEKL